MLKRQVMGMNRRTLLAASGALLGSSLLKTAGGENAPNNGAQLKSASGSVPETFNLFDFESPARQRIPHAAYEYIAGGAADEITLRWNREAFDALALRPRVLVDQIKSLTLLARMRFQRGKRLL